MSNVLIATADLDLLRLGGATLAVSGHQVHDVSSGAEALKFIGRERIDLLITDVVLPDSRGQDVVEQAWKVAPDLPVIFLIDYSVADEICCEVLGKALVVTKPFGPAALRGAAAKALGSKPAESRAFRAPVPE